MQILDIFLLFGAPNILQSDNGAEFTASIISQLKDLWPECKFVDGKPRHPQSQGSVLIWCSFNSRMVAKIFLKLHKFYSNLPIFTTVFAHPCYGHIPYTKCSNTVHVICGKTNGEEGFGRSVLC
jgi:hypothetical protein